MDYSVQELFDINYSTIEKVLEDMRVTRGIWKISLEKDNYESISLNIKNRNTKEKLRLQFYFSNFIFAMGIERFLYYINVNMPFTFINFEHRKVDYQEIKDAIDNAINSRKKGDNYDNELIPVILNEFGESMKSKYVHHDETFIVTRNVVAGNNSCLTLFILSDNFSVSNKLPPVTLGKTKKNNVFARNKGEIMQIALSGLENLEDELSPWSEPEEEEV